MGEIARVARRELAAFFGSPVAYIFIGTFLAVSLFVFFWVDAFFARNIADTRPLFEWMPILLIFLCAALTMRLWSEERRAGTLETLLTLPVPTPKLVLGKFLAAMALVTVALALTLPLPVTVSLLGPLDWGPVIGAYLATLLLAAAYISVGLFVSSRTDNPIVALIGTALVCAVFYLIGSPALTALVGHSGGEVLRLLGSGARFESITRGVIDLRDLYYYLSIVGVFLVLSVYSLERLRWAEQEANPRHHRRWSLVTMLVAANLVAVNVWMQPVGAARMDLTQGHLYTISEATRNYLSQLQEPLLIRGYFSAQTHPLLAPLVPQLRDLLEELEIAGKGKVRVEFVDPQQSPELEREAGEKYGIRPVAFQTETKYQAAVVNSYFDILVKYGDQFEKLGFQDLIDVKVRSESDLDVRLRNPEYDLVRAIKKVLYGYQGGGDLFANLSKPVHFQGFISDAATLPKPLPELRKDLESILGDLKAKSDGRFTFEIKDPTAGDGSLAKTIKEKYGFQPLVAGLLNPTPFYFDMVVESGDRTEPVPLPESLDRAGLERAVQAAIKRFAPGVLRTVALYTPSPASPEMGMLGQGGGSDYSLLEQKLRDGFSVRSTDLKSGQVPEDTDLLMVVAPEDLDQKQQFAIDQFLMQGGTVILAASDFNIDLGGGSISARKAKTGLEGWLDQQGVKLGESLVLDPQNTPFPIPVQRDIGGFRVQEIQTLDYPYFPDIRTDGLSQDSGITSNLGQITMNWTSPIEIDAKKNASRKVTRLIQSSSGAWTSDSVEMQPDFDRYGGLGFKVGDDKGRKLLAASIEGRFQSAFAGKPSPLLAKGDEDKKDEDPTDEPAGDESKDKKPTIVPGVVESSPESSRLILIGSSSFLTDTAISLANEATQSRYLKPVELAENAVEWSLEDRGLLSLRGRGQFSRLLEPLGQQARLFWESLNYLLALAGLALVYWVHRMVRARRERFYTAILGNGGTN